MGMSSSFGMERRRPAISSALSTGIPAIIATTSSRRISTRSAALPLRTSRTRNRTVELPSPWGIIRGSTSTPRRLRSSVSPGCSARGTRTSSTFSAPARRRRSATASPAPLLRSAALKA